MSAGLFLLSLDSLKRHQDPTTTQGKEKHKETRAALLLSASITADVTEAFTFTFSLSACGKSNTNLANNEGPGTRSNFR